MHHGTCVTHVPWCMSGSLACGDGENVPGIPGAYAPASLRIWQEAHGSLAKLQFQSGHGWIITFHKICIWTIFLSPQIWPCLPFYSDLVGSHFESSPSSACRRSFYPPKLTKSIISFRTCWVPFWTSSDAPLLIFTLSAPPPPPPPPPPGVITFMS